jgi:hypothetical protein
MNFAEPHRIAVIFKRRLNITLPGSIPHRNHLTARSFCVFSQAFRMFLLHSRNSG